MSIVKANDLQSTSGAIPTVKGQNLIPTAWCNFNASTNVINGSENVSSLTDNGSGKHRVNFATALANTNYSSAVTGSVNSNLATWSTTGAINNYDDTKSVNYAPVITANNGNNIVDSYDLSVIILGGQ